MKKRFIKKKDITRPKILLLNVLGFDSLFS